MKEMDKIIGWWSGGITSAVACKIAIDIYGVDNCRVIFIDTKNEDEDTYRFKKDCENWYNLSIETITSQKHNSIQDVWRRYKALNNAKGAVCSSELKRQVRETWEKTNTWKYQVFGFELDEQKRAKAMKLNHSHTNPIFPLMLYGYTKKECIDIVKDANIDIPNMYKLGFLNNNCFVTGCVQGGVGYWGKMKKEHIDKFNKMADLEHELTNIKGKPVTMLKDQSNEAKESGNILVFLKKHPDYPMLKCIDDMPSCKVEPLFECNGFCGINDLEPRSKTEQQINYTLDL